MTVPNPSLPARGNSARRYVGFLSLAVISGFLLAACSNTRVSTADPASPIEQISAIDPSLASPSDTSKEKEPAGSGRKLFEDWPANQKPDAVIVFSGQTFGYVQPCGCSRPQTGGLERRAVLIEMLKAKGWPVAGIDLGDVAPEKPPADKVWLADQGRMKYVATMNSLREMGYLAVGVGKTELASDLYSLLAAYSLQKEQRPFILAGNAVGKSGNMEFSREQFFKPEGKRPLIELIEVGKVGEMPVGVAGVVGKALNDENEKQKWDTLVAFPNEKKAIEAARDALAKDPLKPQLKVLIFQGPSGDAAKVAKDFPEFQVIICQADDALPPLKPQEVSGAKHPKGQVTHIVQVGHKGQHVGVLGAFKKADGSFDFKYQLVQLGEEYITPGTDAEAIQKNKTLRALEDYAEEVKKAKFLSKYPRVAHPEQIRAAGLKPPVNDLAYVGTDACKACHVNEYNAWKKHPHSHAVETLEKVAKRPDLRQFDGECMQCHTVGFHYKTGAYDPKNDAAKNVLLHNVGCESCHGPGSGHVADPKRKDLLELMSTWKQAGAKKLPDAAFIKKMADTPPQDRGKHAIEPAQQLLIRRVEEKCVRCHDHEADPHFDLYKAWQKVDHTGLTPGGWPEKAPK